VRETSNISNKVKAFFIRIGAPKDKAKRVLILQNMMQRLRGPKDYEVFKWTRGAIRTPNELEQVISDMQQEIMEDILLPEQEQI
jgi:hypothetical protein